jgi:hypothetical protein
MDPERWRKVTEIFHAAPARESGARAAFLADVCGDDAALRGDVETLLAGDARARDGGDPFAQAAPSVSPGTTPGLHRIESAMAPAVPPGRSDPARPSIAAAAHCSASSICAPRSALRCHGSPGSN